MFAGSVPKFRREHRQRSVPTVCGPQVGLKGLGITRKPFVAERKERVGTYVSSQSLGYHSGAQPSIILKVMNKILNIILCSTGSQCNFLVMELYGLGHNFSQRTNILPQNSVGAEV